MNTITKFAASGALALSLLGTSLAAAPAQANDFGGGLAVGLATGLIIGNFNNSYHHNSYHRVSCHYGPTQVRWVQVCDTDDYGNYFCRNVKRYYTPRSCY